MEISKTTEPTTNKPSGSSANSDSTSSPSEEPTSSSAVMKESNSRSEPTQLTEEQKERIRVNREKALVIRKRKQEEQLEKEKRRKMDENVELEPFEEGASEFVTKTEAMKTYCLPEGTLNVCEYVEKPNPHNAKWKPMKLYYRGEVRRRARERYGGLQGLIEERDKRQKSRFEKDYQKAQNLFK